MFITRKVVLILVYVVYACDMDKNEDIRAEAVTELRNLGVDHRTRVVSYPLGWEGAVLNMETDRGFAAQVYAYVEVPHDFQFEVRPAEQRISISVTEPWDFGGERPQATLNLSRAEALTLRHRLGLVLDATSPH